MQKTRLAASLTRSGFSLVELVVTMAVLSILLSIATLQFNRLSKKSAVESQTKAMHADLMTVRSEALFQKRSRAVRVTATSFAVYSSGAATGTPLLQKSLRHPLALNGVPNPVVFNSRGLIGGVTNASICVEASDNGGAVDSLVLSTTRIQMGKRDGASCESDNIERK